MFSSMSKTVLVLATVATLAAVQPSNAEACIFRRWWDRCTGQQAARVTFFAPSACGTCQPACNTCQSACTTCQPVQPACPQQVCSYQPQTCFRTVFQQVPVTVYRPVTTVDPCTGCPSTTMQACTTMTTQAQRVPFTSFRQVCQMVQPAAVEMAPAMQVQQFQPMQMQMMQQPQQFAMPTAPVNPGCATCQGGYAPSAPAPYAAVPSYQQQYQPAPTTQPAPQGPVSSLTPMSADQAPALQQSPSYYQGPVQGPTFPSNNSTSQYPTTTQYPSTSNYPAVTTTPSTSGGLYPVPTTTPSTGTSYQPRVPASAPAIRPLPDVDRREPAAPALLNPQDRTAARELPATGTIAPISWEQVGQRVAPAAAAVKRLDDSGWRPAR